MGLKQFRGPRIIDERRNGTVCSVGIFDGTAAGPANQSSLVDRKTHQYITDESDRYVYEILDYLPVLLHTTMDV